MRALFLPSSVRPPRHSHRFTVCAGPKPSPVTNPKNANNNNMNGRGQQSFGGRPGSAAGPRFNTCSDGPVDRKPVEQVSFGHVMPSDPLVGIVGGGISGLACALELARLGCHSVVFDTGEHGVGGRAATRAAAESSLRHPAPPKLEGGLVFDHAAQYFTATDPSFAAEVENWVKAGVVREWKGAVVSVDARTKRATPLVDGNGPDGKPLKRYIVPKGFRNLAVHIAQDAAREALSKKAKLEVRRPCWVNVMRAEKGGWRLTAKGRDQGVFDAVAIAHNGKCANRLLGNTGVPAVEKQMRSLLLSSLWVAMVAVRMPPGGAKNVPEGAFVEGSEVLSWACNNSAKLGLQEQHRDIACWTLISTPEYGKRNKVPQEAVPPEVARQVIQDLLQSANTVLNWGIAPEDLSARVVYSKAQLWGAALPINTPSTPCVYDAVGRAGICGDWCTGGSIQAAYESGRALAQRIAKTRGHPSTEQLSLGLTNPLKPYAASPIGEFPGAKTPVAEVSAQRGGGGGRGGGRFGGGGRGGGGRGNLSGGPSRVQQGSGAGPGKVASGGGWSTAMGQRKP